MSAQKVYCITNKYIFYIYNKITMLNIHVYIALTKTLKHYHLFGLYPNPIDIQSCSQEFMLIMDSDVSSDLCPLHECCLKPVCCLNYRPFSYIIAHVVMKYDGNQCQSMNIKG